METQQPLTQKRSEKTFKKTVYNISSRTWIVTSWIWTAIIIALLIQFVPAYLLAEHTPIWNTVLVWLNNGTLAFPWNILRIFAITGLPVLLCLTILAWMLKHRLRDAPEGLDRLIHVLEHDTITPQLEVLQEQCGRLLQTQVACFNVLSQVPTSSELQGLRSSSQQEQLTWQKEFAQALQDIQIRATEHVQRLGDLHQQGQYIEESIYAHLRAITHLLEQIRDTLNVAPGESQRSPLSDQWTIVADEQQKPTPSSPLTTTEPMMAVTSSPAPEEPEPSTIQYTTRGDSESLSA